MDHGELRCHKSRNCQCVASVSKGAHTYRYEAAEDAATGSRVDVKKGFVLAVVCRLKEYIHIANHNHGRKQICDGK